MHRIIEARAFRKNENVDAMRGIDDAMANILTAFWQLQRPKAARSVSVQPCFYRDSDLRANLVDRVR